MELTSKQRAALRAMANGIDTIAQIGKGEIDEDIIRLVDEALTARELIKLRVLQNSMSTAKEAATALSEATGAAVVQVIGTRFVLYRPNPKKPVIVI